MKLLNMKSLIAFACVSLGFVQVSLGANKTFTVIESRSNEASREQTGRIGDCHQTVRANFIDRWGFEIEEKVTKVGFLVEVVYEHSNWTGNSPQKETLVPGSTQTFQSKEVRTIETTNDGGYNACEAMRKLYTQNRN